MTPRYRCDNHPKRQARRLFSDGAALCPECALRKTRRETGWRWNTRSWMYERPDQRFRRDAVGEARARREAGFSKEVARTRRYEELRLLDKEQLLEHLRHLDPEEAQLSVRDAKAILCATILAKEIP